MSSIFPNFLFLFFSIAIGNEGIFVTASHDKILKVWDANLAGTHTKPLQEFQGHASFVVSCDLSLSTPSSPSPYLSSPSSFLVASVSLDSTLRLWHPSSPFPIFSANLPHHASCVRFVSGENIFLLTAGKGKEKERDYKKS